MGQLGQNMNNMGNHIGTQSRSHALPSSFENDPWAKFNQDMSVFDDPNFPFTNGAPRPLAQHETYGSPNNLFNPAGSY